MPTFAVFEGSVIQNIIIADSLEIAQDVTGKPCSEIGALEDVPGIGFVLNDGKFTDPDPDVWPVQEPIAPTTEGVQHTAETYVPPTL